MTRPIISSVFAERLMVRQAAIVAGGLSQPIALVRNLSIPGPAGPLECRLYHPHPEQELPLILFFHGGGWRSGDLDSHDKVCRRVAAYSDLPVLSVSYRLTPEHAFPAAHEDAYAALLWAAQQAPGIGGDPSRIIVMGDSAGGNLAATVALRARDEGSVPIFGQVLIYPVADLTNLDRPSYRLFGIGQHVARPRMQLFIETYVPDPEQRFHPYASPLLAGNLKGLPPALVLTAQFDPLHDEGLEYALALQNAGTPVHLTEYKGVFHGFFGLPLLGGAKAIQAVREVATVVKGWLA